jgi:protein-disulfide isomerase
MSTINTSTLLGVVGLLVGTAGLAVGGYALSKTDSLEARNNELTQLISIAEMSKEAMPIPTTSNITNEAFTALVMDNPEAIIKSLTKHRFEQEQLAKEQEGQQIGNLQEAIYEDANDPFFGNPNGKHVVVEFMDYNCVYCKQLAPVLEEFVKVDPEAKVIIKEYPIFRNLPSSAYSALVGTAIFMTKPELYDDFHHMVLSQKRVTNDSVDLAITKLGLTKDDLQPALQQAERQVEKNRTLGAQINVSGTPTLIINGQKVGGSRTVDALMAHFN